MDGRISKEDATGRSGHATTVRGFSVTEASDEETGAAFSSMRSAGSRSGGADEFSLKLRDKELEEPDPAGRASFGGQFWGLGGVSALERDPSAYLHPAPLFLVTHVVHGCLASHFLQTV